MLVPDPFCIYIIYFCIYITYFCIYILLLSQIFDTPTRLLTLGHVAPPQSPCYEAQTLGTHLHLSC